MKGALIVFARPPVPGRVKTRLVPYLSNEDAAALYAAFLQDALDQYAALDLDVRLYFTDVPESEVVLPAYRLQTGDDLGERMMSAFAETFADGYDGAIVVGTDHPTLPTPYIKQGFSQLETPRSVVLGPADDGGYYLLGMNDLRPELFRDMTYSHEGVFDETLRRAAGTNVAILPSWYDVDTPEALQWLRNKLRDEPPETAPHTRAVLKKLEEAGRLAELEP